MGDSLDSQAPLYYQPLIIKKGWGKDEKIYCGFIILCDYGIYTG